MSPVPGQLCPSAWERPFIPTRRGAAASSEEGRHSPGLAGGKQAAGKVRTLPEESTVGVQQAIRGRNRLGGESGPGPRGCGPRSQHRAPNSSVLAVLWEPVTWTLSQRTPRSRLAARPKSLQLGGCPPRGSRSPSFESHVRVGAFLVSLRERKRQPPVPLPRHRGPGGAGWGGGTSRPTGQVAPGPDQDLGQGSSRVQDQSPASSLEAGSGRPPSSPRLGGPPDSRQGPQGWPDTRKRGTKPSRSAWPRSRCARAACRHGGLLRTGWSWGTWLGEGRHRAPSVRSTWPLPRAPHPPPRPARAEAQAGGRGAARGRPGLRPLSGDRAPRPSPAPDGHRILTSQRLHHQDATAEGRVPRGRLRYRPGHRPPSAQPPKRKGEPLPPPP